MKILLSNDDGYLAPGLIHLARGISDLAEVTVIAPDRNQSGIGNALTLDRPLRVTRADNGFIHVDGTPADCVHLAITGLLREKCDAVLSGINMGRNLGDDVLYSGTVAAAMEARFLGVPSIALSLTSEEPVHFETAVQVARLLLNRIDDHGCGDTLPGDTILNVNIPDVPWQDIRGFEVTRLGSRNRPENMVPANDPRGRVIHWIGPVGSERDAGPGTDFFAIRNNKVSITPIRADSTRHSALEPIADWIGKIRPEELYAKVILHP